MRLLSASAGTALAASVVSTHNALKATRILSTPRDGKRAGE
jgi:hypothetical protein